MRGRESCRDRAGTNGAGGPPGEDGHERGGKNGRNRAGTGGAGAARRRAGLPASPWFSPAVPRRDVGAGAAGWLWLAGRP